MACTLGAGRLIGDTYAMGESTEPLSFGGLSPDTFSWFTGLQADNSKQYFNGHRELVRQLLEHPLERASNRPLISDWPLSMRSCRPQDCSPARAITHWPRTSSLASVKPWPTTPRASSSSGR
jgi:hypothetical protein